MTKRFNSYAAVIGLIAIALTAGLLPGPQQVPLDAVANAQEKGQPEDRSTRRVVEIGPERYEEKKPCGMFGFHTTHSDGRVESLVRAFQPFGATFVLKAEDVAGFLAFARQIDEKRKDLQPHPPIE